MELIVNKRAVLNRPKTVRGNLFGIIRVTESDAYFVEVTKQISAVQSSLERANRVMLHNHLERCFLVAVPGGRGRAAIDELIDAVKLTPALTGQQVELGGAAVGEPVDDDPLAAAGAG
ncbi:metal-sensitive transcriptional regulator [Mycobacterium marinum]|nr:metal-sensitive transcriptional regulator [Mycobacterium marinum]